MFELVLKQTSLMFWEVLYGAPQPPEHFVTICIQMFTQNGVWLCKFKNLSYQIYKIISFHKVKCLGNCMPEEEYKILCLDFLKFF